jgi:futalosine hydrolase
MKPVIITAATFTELSLFVAATGLGRSPEPSPFVVYEGEFAGRHMIAAISGIGKVNAAACTASLLAGCTPGLLISTGCAGAFPGSGLGVGDLAAATTEIYGDEGVLTPAGWASLELIGIPVAERDGRRYFNEIPLAAPSAERAVTLANDLGIGIRPGRFLTVSTCSGTAARGEELQQRFDCICENMEGAAVAQTALRYGIDCLEVRGVSNLVEDRDLSRWDIGLAVERAQRFLLAYIETLQA